MASRSERYDQAFAAITEVVNGHDPVGLLQMGAPQDEYEPKVADLVRMVLADDPIEEKDVDEVWVRWFGESYRMAGTEPVTTLTRELRTLQARFARRTTNVDALPAPVPEAARIYDNGEVAWPRDAAAAAIEALGATRNLILGLDFRREVEDRISEAPWSAIDPRDRTPNDVPRTVRQALDDLEKGLEHEDLLDFPWVLVTWEPLR